MVQLASQDEFISRPSPTLESYSNTGYCIRIVAGDGILCQEEWQTCQAFLASRLFFHRQIYKPARLSKVVIMMKGREKVSAFRSRNNGLAKVSWLEDDSLSFVCTNKCDDGRRKIVQLGN